MKSPVVYSITYFAYHFYFEYRRYTGFYRYRFPSLDDTMINRYPSTNATKLT